MQKNSEIKNYNQSFNEWFNELEGYSLRSERFLDSLDAFTSKEALAKSMILWLKAAYDQGCRDAAQDSIDTLRQFGTVVSGLDEKLTRTEGYDTSAQNLMVYFTHVLNSNEKD